MAAVNWWWLCLALPFVALFNGNVCITIDPESTSGNDTDMTASQPQQAFSNVEDNATLAVAVADSELSASERTRRLIPYMAFYLPVQELPINQQYASIQSTKHGATRPSGTGATGSHIPVPPQYVHMKLPALSGLGGSGTGGTSYLQSAPAAAHYQASAGDVYHTLTYGGGPQHQQPHYQLLPTANNNGNHKYPGHHLLSPGPPGPSAPSTVNLAGGKINPIRLKTVQHFPPLPSQTTATSSSSAYETSAVKQHPQQQQRGVAYRPRTKQSKINLTPFTPSNTVPGNFVPIVYTPVNSNNNNNNIVITAQTAATADNTNTDNAAATALSGGGKQQQIAIEYSAPLASPIDDAPQHHRPPPQHQHAHHHHQHPHHNPKQQGQYFSVTPSSLSPSGGEAVGPGGSSQHHPTQTVGPPSTYQLQQHPEHAFIDASSRPPQQSQQLTLIGSKQQQTQQQFRTKGTHFHPSKPENFFGTELQLLPQQQHHHHHHVEQQRPRYSDKQLHPQEQAQGQHQQYLTKAKYHERVKQPAHIFVLSSTAAPHDGADTALSPIHPSQNPHYSSKYPQHSPIHHSLYPQTPQDSSPHGQQNLQNNEASSSPPQSHLPFGEQILTIPVHTLFGDLRNYQHNHYASPPPSSSHNSGYPKPNGHSTPQYIDYPVDEPKQSLDDDQIEPYQQQQHHVQHPLETLKPTLGPPSHAYIIVTTAAPYHRHPVTQENYGSTIRPLYKNKPNVRLQPVSNEKNVNYPAIRQPNPTAKPVVSITPTPNTFISDSAPKYVYVKEEFGQKLSTPSIKLKPLNKYENDKQMPINHHPQELQPQVSRPPNLAVGKGPNEPSTAIAESPHQQLHSPNSLADPNELPDIRTSSLAEILHKLQESNHLPHTLTADNIDNSIKTLIRILNNLKKTQTIVANPPQHHETPPPYSSDYDYTTGSEEQEHNQQDMTSLLPSPTGPNKHPGPSTGRPGIDFPNYAKIPQTSFDCSQQRYKGFFGDPETNCQVWHYCDLNGGKASFLCPNGTIFSQIALTCDWWFNVKCASTAQLYVLNERLYKYILPFTPKFPEDYSGPLVDKYLAMKFQEMEEKMRIEKEKALEEAATEHEDQHETTSEDSREENRLDEITTESEPSPPPVAPAAPAAPKHESVNSHVSEQSSERNLLIDDEVDDISQRGSIDTFESTTIASAKPKDLPLSLRPIVVSSTVEPDYDEDEQQQRSHEDVKRHGEANVTNKTDMHKQHKITKETLVNIPEKHVLSTANSKVDDMKITVEKVEVIEIKPDGATGHLIREMILNSETK